jgi:HEAT repeat protein
MRIRYLVLGPLGELAPGGDHAAAARIADAIVHDTDWPVRARAAELGARLPEARASLVSAARDPEPRVREAAFASLAAAPAADATRTAADALSHEAWPFVKVQAIAVLVSSGPSSDVDDALGGVLHDGSTQVRGAAIVALMRRRASSWRGGMRERLDDPNEDGDVRAAAASALGAVCDASSADRLTELARAMLTQPADEDAQKLGLGALFGLAALQPKDLRSRIAPLLAPSAPANIRAAAQQVLIARAACR